MLPVQPPHSPPISRVLICIQATSGLSSKYLQTHSESAGRQRLLVFASNFRQSLLKLQRCIKMIITNDWLVMRTWETDPGPYLHKRSLCIIYFVAIYTTTAQYHLICTYFNHFVNLRHFAAVWTTFSFQMRIYFNSNLWEWLLTRWNIMTSNSVVHSWCVFRGDGAQASQRFCPTTPPTACLISSHIFMLSVLERLAPSTCHALSTLGARAAQEMASLLPCT